MPMMTQMSVPRGTGMSVKEMTGQLDYLKNELQRVQLGLAQTQVELAQARELLQSKEVQISHLLTVQERYVF